MQHFLISFEQTQDGVPFVHSLYYANAKKFSFDDFGRLPESTHIAVMQQIQPGGVQGSATLLLEFLAQTNPEMVISGLIRLIAASDHLPESPILSRPIGWFSIKVAPCYEPEATALGELQLTQAGIEVWSFKAAGASEHSN